MARLPRLAISGYPHHIIQRGNNRQPICLETADYETLIALLDQSARKFQVALHAYVIMGNHFHLLVTPQNGEDLSRMMQAVGRGYVRYFNSTHQRTGTLWEGRYRSAVLQAQSYLLTCMAYMDLNPVRSGLVGQAADYPWSSHSHYIGQRLDRCLTPHPLTWQLGNTPFAREAAYAQIVQTGISSVQYRTLTESLMHGWALGEPSFVAELQKKTTRRLTKGAPGRPPTPKTSA